jgi:hypothetical protein
VATESTVPAGGGQYQRWCVRLLLASLLSFAQHLGCKATLRIVCVFLDTCNCMVAIMLQAQLPQVCICGYSSGSCAHATSARAIALAGVLLCRRSPEAHRWLEAWWRRGFADKYNGCFHDQTCLKVRLLMIMLSDALAHYILNKAPGICKHVVCHSAGDAVHDIGCLCTSTPP